VLYCGGVAIFKGLSGGWGKNGVVRKVSCFESAVIGSPSKGGGSWRPMGEATRVSRLTNLKGEFEDSLGALEKTLVAGKNL